MVHVHLGNKIITKLVTVPPGIVVSSFCFGFKGTIFLVITFDSFSREMINPKSITHLFHDQIITFIQHPSIVGILYFGHSLEGLFKQIIRLFLRNETSEHRHLQVWFGLDMYWFTHEKHDVPYCQTLE